MATGRQAMARGRYELRARAAEMGPWIEWLGRLGYAARGIVYVLIGVLAAQAAFGSGGATTGSEGVLRRIVHLPFGQTILVAIAIGIAGYALWRFVQAVLDTENKGSDAKGITMRSAYAIVGLVYCGLAASAVRLVIGAGDAQDRSSQEWTAWLLSQPFGQWLVGLVGAAVIAFGCYQLYQAYSAEFRKWLKFGQMGRTAGRWTVGLGRFGHGSRGLVFGIVGVFLIVAAVQADPSDTRGLGGALQALSEQPFGPWLFAIVAVGLIAFGAFSLLLAKYRRMLIR